MRLAAAAVATTAIALTGACAADDKTGNPAGGTPSSAAPSLSPADALTASVKGLATTPYVYAVKTELISYGGSTDATAGKYLIDASMDLLGEKMKFEGRIDGKEWHAKIDQGPDAFKGKWIHLDPAKLKEQGTLGFQELKDPSGIQLVLPGLTATEKTADGTIKGTVDLTKISDDVLFLVPTDMTELADKAKAVPFQAKLDGSGRLTSLTFEVPGTDGDPAEPVSYTFSDWGKAVTVEKPAGAIEADADIYKYFNTTI